MASAPAWSTTQPPKVRSCKHKILRCPPVRLRPFVITSDEVLYVGIHWMNGRSKPCPGETDCPECKKQYPTYKGYLSVWNPETNESYCLEITPPCFGTCAAYRQLYSTLRGGTMSLSRKGTKDNGRLSAAIVPSGIPPTQLPDPIDVQATMVEAWDSPDRKSTPPMKPPPDTLANETEARELVARLKRDGYIDADGNPTGKTSSTDAFEKAVTNERFKLSKTYEATDDQKAMLERNRLAKTNGNGRTHK